MDFYSLNRIFANWNGETNFKTIEDYYKNIKMNFLFVSGRVPILNHIVGGAGVRSSALIKALAQIGNVDVISFVKEPIESHIPNCNVVYSKYVPNENRLLLNSVRNRVWRNLKLFFQPRNPHTYFYTNKEREKIVVYYHNQKHYDYVACHYIDDMVNCGLLRYLNKLIIDVDDNLVSITKFQLSNIDSAPLVIRLRNKWRTHSVGLMQRHILKNARLSFYSNMNEPPFERSVFLHNVPQIKGGVSDVTDLTPMRILFTGLLNYFPNRYGIIHFVERIFPLIKKKIPQLELNIVGLCNKEEVLLKLKSVNGVNVCGHVDNIQDEYINCRVAVVPIYHGAGTSVKFIEGVMMNRPVVSTPIGARGYSSVFKSDKHYMLAKTDQEFADSVIELLTNREKANEMTREAYTIGESYFSERKFVEIVKDAINKLQQQ